MQVFSDEPSVLWWSSPNVLPTSWHRTCSLSDELSYAGSEKYVSFTFTVPCVMCFVPDASQICATPSQPLLPYEPLQTSTRPAVALQRLLRDSPGTTVVSRTVDFDQSADVVGRHGSQLDD